jgi:hypothetical protein
MRRLYYLLVLVLLTGRATASDFHHDFRGGGALPAELALQGPNAEAVVKQEAGGLHITLPTDGKQTKGWGVAVRITLSGDFEITGSYELLSAEPPLNGRTAGVAIGIAPDAKRVKFTKVGRFVRDGGENVYICEFWSKDPPKPWRFELTPTETRSGKLRITRQGSIVRCLVAEGLDAEFQEIFQEDFGEDDLQEIVFIANNNASPTPVEARLLDLTIRSDTSRPTPTLDTSKAGLALAQLVGLAITLLIIGLAATWFYLHQRRRAANPPRAEAEVRRFSCPECGAHLRAGVELAGRKMKCARCGKVLVVPQPAAGAS